MPFLLSYRSPILCYHMANQHQWHLWSDSIQNSPLHIVGHQEYSLLAPTACLTKAFQYCIAFFMLCTWMLTQPNTKDARVYQQQNGKMWLGPDILGIIRVFLPGASIMVRFNQCWKTIRRLEGKGQKAWDIFPSFSCFGNKVGARVPQVFLESNGHSHSKTNRGYTQSQWTPEGYEMGSTAGEYQGPLFNGSMCSKSMS